MKNIFLILGLIVIFVISGLSVGAKTNLLHSITVEKGSGNYNIVLDTDNITKVVRKVESRNELVLELSGITSSDTVNALYKGSAVIDNLVIENSGFNKLKIYITAPDIESANIVLQPVSGEVLYQNNSLSSGSIVLIVFLTGLLSLFIKHIMSSKKEDNRTIVKRDIKEREIELYRQYKNSLDIPVSLQSKDVRMKKVLKKIDRKIDERLSLLSK